MRQALGLNCGILDKRIFYFLGTLTFFCRFVIVKLWGRIWQTAEAYPEIFLEGGGTFEIFLYEIEKIPQKEGVWAPKLLPEYDFDRLA